MAFIREKSENACLICGGNLETANLGSICNACKDTLRVSTKPVVSG